MTRWGRRAAPRLAGATLAVLCLGAFAPIHQHGGLQIMAGRANLEAPAAAPLHPEVVAALMLRPELPWMYEGYLPGAEAEVRTLAAELTPLLNSVLAASPTVKVTSLALGEVTVEPIPSAEAIFVTWVVFTGNVGVRSRSFSYDVRGIPEAFVPTAQLPPARLAGARLLRMPAGLTHAP